MLLELDNTELEALIENDDALVVRIEKLFNLYNHYMKGYWASIWWPWKHVLMTSTNIRVDAHG
jgi:hypothetical protein